MSIVGGVVSSLKSSDVPPIIKSFDEEASKNDVVSVAKNLILAVPFLYLLPFFIFCRFWGESWL